MQSHHDARAGQYTLDTGANGTERARTVPVSLCPFFQPFVPVSRLYILSSIRYAALLVYRRDVARLTPSHQRHIHQHKMY